MNDSDKVLTYEDAKQLCMKAFDGGSMTATTDERKMCLDCDLYDIMTGNIYGVCLKDSYIDSEEDSYLQWMYPQAWACEYFKEIDRVVIHSS